MIETAGLAILHFLWQGAALGLLAWLLLSLQKQAKAQTRYVTGCILMAFMALAPLFTALFLLPGKEKFEPFPGVKETIILAAAPIAEKENSLYAWILGLYLAGTLILTIRCLGGLAILNRLKTKGIADPPEWLQNAFLTVKQKLQITQQTQLLLSSQVTVPTVLGAFKGVVLIPAGALAGVSPQMLEMLLAHELAHVKRYDFLVNILQTCIEIALFYHPAVWWLSNRIRQEREHCCDDLVLATFGDRKVYARALSTAEEMRLASLALRANGGDLLARIRRILGETHMKSIASPTALAVMAGVLVMGTALQSQAAARLDPLPQDQAKQKEAQRDIERARAELNRLERELQAARERLAAAERAMKDSQSGAERGRERAKQAQAEQKRARDIHEKVLKDVQRQLEATRSRKMADSEREEIERALEAIKRIKPAQQKEIQDHKAAADKIREIYKQQGLKERDKAAMEKALQDLHNFKGQDGKAFQEFFKAKEMKGLDDKTFQEFFKAGKLNEMDHKAFQEFFKAKELKGMDGKAFQDHFKAGDLKGLDHKAFEDLHRFYQKPMEEKTLQELLNKARESGKMSDDMIKSFKDLEIQNAKTRLDFKDLEQMRAHPDLFQGKDRKSILDYLDTQNKMKREDIDLFLNRNRNQNENRAMLDILNKLQKENPDSAAVRELLRTRYKGDRIPTLDLLRSGKLSRGEDLKTLIEREEKALVTLRSTPTGDMTDEEREEHKAKIKAREERLKALKSRLR